MKYGYLALCLAGAALPLALASFLPWLAEHGLHLRLMWQQIHSTPLSAFAWADVLVSGVVSIVFIISESHRLRMQHGPLTLLGLCVGVSLALPLFPYLRRKRRLERRADAHA